VQPLTTAVPDHIGPSFAAWWCAPTPPPNISRSLLASRCEPLAQGPAKLGEIKDWVWANLSHFSPGDRLQFAQRFSCILAAQVPPLTQRLQTLDSALRAWALPIASVQPLPRLIDWGDHPTIDGAVLAWAEIGLWISHDFPNLWQRLLADWPQASRQNVADLVAAHPNALAQTSPVVRRRVLRCWALVTQFSEPTPWDS
jgi:hypothetical protein